MKKHWGIILLSLYVVFQLIALPHVGFTWDEPSIYFIGKRNRDFWQRFPSSIPTGPDYSIDVQPTDGKLRLVWGAKYYPPLMPTLASFSELIFTEKLHIADFVTGYHIAILLWGTLGVFALYGIGRMLGFPQFSSTGIALAYGLYPTIVGQMRNDAKDVPLTSGIVIFVYCLLRLFKSWERRQGQMRWAIACGISLGLGIMIKPTAAIMVPIVGIFFLLACLFPTYRRHLPSFPVLILTPILVGLLSVMTVLLLWPWMWDDPVGKMTTTMTFFKNVGVLMPVLYFGNVYQTGVNLPWQYPFSILFIQTPPGVLVLGVLGVFAVIWQVIKKKDPIPLLFIIWFSIGIGRFLVPGFLIYAKMRHLIDIIPAMFILAAYGVECLRKIHYKNIPVIGNFGNIAIVIIIIHELFIVWQFFPYEPSYFNSFVGGTKTVAEKRWFDVEYWGASVKEGMEYIKIHDPSPVAVYTCGMWHMAKYYQDSHVTAIRQAQGAKYLIIPNSASFFGEIVDRMNASQDLVYTVRRAGADLLYIFKRGENGIPQCGQESEDTP
jgi:hypothetical protein